MINAWLHGIVYVLAVLGFIGGMILFLAWMDRLSDQTRFAIWLSIIAFIMLVPFPIALGYGLS